MARALSSHQNRVFVVCRMWYPEFDGNQQQFVGETDDSTTACAQKCMKNTKKSHESQERLKPTETAKNVFHNVRKYSRTLPPARFFKCTCRWRRAPLHFAEPFRKRCFVRVLSNTTARKVLLRKIRYRMTQIVFVHAFGAHGHRFLVVLAGARAKPRAHE